MKRSHVAALRTFVAVGLVSASAAGQVAAPPVPVVPPRYVAPVPLDLTTSAVGAGFEIYHPDAKPGRDAPVVVCPTSCRVWVYPGTYLIRITEAEGTLAGNREIEVRRPMSIDFDPDTSAKRTAGLVLGVAGPVMIISGLGLALGTPTDSDDDYEDEAALGALLLLGGLAATPVGWVMFGTSYKPEYEIGAPLPGAPPPPTWSFGPAVTGSSAGFVATARF